MSKVKFILIVSILVLILGVAGGLLAVKEIRDGLMETISSSVSSTLALVGLKDDKEPNTTNNQPQQSVNPAQPFNNVNQQPQNTVASVQKQRAKDNLEVHILNTFGDVVILKEGNMAVLINGGFIRDSVEVKNYLNKIGVKKVRYLIGTNYHASSIEGMSKILSYLYADYIFLSENILTGKIGTNLVKYLNAHKLVWTHPKENGVYKLDKVRFSLLPSNPSGSIMVLVQNGETKMLFTGSTTRFDDEFLNKLPTNITLYSANVYNKSYRFPAKVLAKVKPKNVVLVNKSSKNVKSVEVTIKNSGATLYSTNVCGHTVIGSNGSDIVITCAGKKN